MLLIVLVICLRQFYDPFLYDAGNALVKKKLQET